VQKAFLWSLVPIRPWRQVVPNYSRRQDVLRGNTVSSSSPV